MLHLRLWMCVQWRKLFSSNMNITSIFGNFLLSQVSRCLHEILDLCNSFVSLLHRCDKLQLSVEEKAGVEQIAKVCVLVCIVLVKY